jgi:hypothetical protein
MCINIYKPKEVYKGHERIFYIISVKRKVIIDTSWLSIENV